MASFDSAGAGASRGIRTGFGIAQSLKSREQEQQRIDLAKGEQFRSMVDDTEARTIEAADKFIEAAAEAAKAGASEQDIDLMVQNFDKIIAGYPVFLQQLREQAIAAEADPNVVSAIPDPNQFIEQQRIRLNAAITAGRAQRREESFETLSNQDVQAAGFPEGAIVQRAGNGKLDVVFDPTENESALETRARFLQESGLPEDVAKSIVGGRRQLSFDPVTRELTVVDIGTGEQIFPEPGEKPAPVDTTRVVPEDIEPERALGTQGFFANIGNIVTDALGLDLSDPKAQEATEAIQQVQTTTKLALQVAIPGRPAKDIRDDLEKLTVTPNSIVQGDQRSLARFKQMRRFIQNNVEEKQAAIDEGGLPPDSIGTLRANIGELNSQLQAYEDIITAMENDGKKNALAAAEEALNAGDGARFDAIMDAIDKDDTEALEKLLNGENN